MFVIKVYNVVVGGVTNTAATNELDGRLMKAALHRAQLNTKGVSFTNPEGTIVYMDDDTLTWAQRLDLAKVFNKYQAEDDTVQYGLEIDYFMNMYLTPEERARLHAGEVRFNELKVQQSLTEEDRRTAEAIQAVRQAKAVA